MSTALQPVTEEGLREVHGRGMNNSSDVYKLPADKQEMDRLSLQHQMWKSMIDGLYPHGAKELVSNALSSGGSKQRSLLDVGSGSGAWAVDMALQFPHVKVLGIDFADPKQPGGRNIPENCSFVRADALKILDDYANQFDVVHSRCVAGHVPDATVLTRKLGTALKRGGIVLLGDGNQYACGPDGNHLPPALDEGDNTGRSWVTRWLIEVTSRMAHENKDLIGGIYMGKFLKANEELEYIGESEDFSPLNWDGGDMKNGKEVSSIMKTVFLDYLTAGKPLLLNNNLPEQTIEQWMQRVREELDDPSKPISMKWSFAWARKKI